MLVCAGGIGAPTETHACENGLGVFYCVHLPRLYGVGGLGAGGQLAVIYWLSMRDVAADSFHSLFLLLLLLFATRSHGGFDPSVCGLPMFTSRLRAPAATIAQYSCLPFKSVSGQFSPRGWVCWEWGAGGGGRMGRGVGSVMN